MATDKEKYSAAKAYIQQKEYTKARKLLREIKHPAAEKLLKTLPPEVTRRTKIIRYVIIGLILLGFAALAITIPRFNQSIEDTNAASRDFFATQQSK